MTSIRLVHTLDVPIYQQIFVQLRHVIESGQLLDGDRLPSTRLLAEELDVNRNTVAKAFGHLREAGLVESRRGGMIVANAGRTRREASARSEIDAVIDHAVRRCLALGLTAEELAVRTLNAAARIESARLRVAFVECSLTRARHLAGAISDRIGLDVVPVVLTEDDGPIGHHDLVLTTYAHLSEVRRRAQGAAGDIVPIASTPSSSTSSALSGLPDSSRLGILHRTDDEAQEVRDALDHAGLPGGRLVAAAADSSFDGLDVLIVPADMVSDVLVSSRLDVIRFETVLAEPSARMLVGLVADIAELSSEPIGLRRRPGSRRRTPHLAGDVTREPRPRAQTP